MCFNCRQKVFNFFNPKKTGRSKPPLHKKAKFKSVSSKARRNRKIHGKGESSE